jgi:hypothetical protein
MVDRGTALLDSQPQARRLFILGVYVLLVILCLSILVVKTNLLTADEIKSVGAIFSGFAFVVGAYWAVATYMNNKRLELQRFFIERQVEIALVTANTVGNLVGCGEQDWEKTKGLFWELYWGRLVLFEDADVINAMVNLGVKLKTKPFMQRSDLVADAYAVSKALRKFLEKRNKDYWMAKFDEAPDQSKAN